MELVLTNEDLAQIDKLIQELPFKYAAPFFQLFQAKIQKANSKPVVNEVDPSAE